MREAMASTRNAVSADAATRTTCAVLVRGDRWNDVRTTTVAPAARAFCAALNVSRVRPVCEMMRATSPLQRSDALTACMWASVTTPTGRPMRRRR